MGCQCQFMLCVLWKCNCCFRPCHDIALYRFFPDFCFFCGMAWGVSGNEWCRKWTKWLGSQRTNILVLFIIFWYFQNQLQLKPCYFTSAYAVHLIQACFVLLLLPSIHAGSCKMRYHKLSCLCGVLPYCSHGRECIEENVTS